MIKGVEKVGIAIEVRVGGNAGPETLTPKAGEVYYIFRFKGWEANAHDDGPVDERIGHMLAQRMEMVGNISADDKITGEEVALLVAGLVSNGNRNEHFHELEGVLTNALAGRRVGISEGMDLARVIASVAGGQGVGNLASVARSIVGGLFGV